MHLSPLSPSDINECDSANGGCGQTCVNLPGSYECSCNEGYILGGDGRSCADIDECAQNSPCSHTCINSPGGFHCECPQGYRLDEDGRECSGTEFHVLQKGLNKNNCSPNSPRFHTHYATLPPPPPHATHIFKHYPTPPGNT